MNESVRTVEAAAVTRNRLGIGIERIKEMPDSTPERPHGKARVRAKGLSLQVEFKTVDGQFTVVFPWEISPLVRVIDHEERQEIEGQLRLKLETEIRSLGAEL